MSVLEQINRMINSLVWGWPMMVFLMGAGLLLTLYTGGVQFRRLPFALKEVLGKFRAKGSGEGSVSPFQALATALASTVGVGNIAGVSTAIYLGGPGALFWLLVSGVLGMATKFSEIAIALCYRKRDSAGVMRGGAMYFLTDGLGLAWLGKCFALLAAFAAFGIGNMVQANSVAAAAGTSFGIGARWCGLILAALTGLVILGGIRRIAEVTQFLVPFMCLLYIGGALVVLIRFASQLPQTIALVVESAFSGHAAVGGFAGAGVMQAIRYGVARGLFSNEAGLGSAPMVHASASTDHPIRQACYGIFEVFVDTVLICTMTGLVVLVTGVWTSGDTGAALSARAFAAGLPGEWGHAVVTTGLICFAFSTILGWAFYGETGATFLLGSRAVLPYRLLWIVFVYVGATGSLHLVWDIADTLNGLMAAPNLVGVIGLLPLLRRQMKEFFSGRPAMVAGWGFRRGGTA